MAALRNGITYIDVEKIHEHPQNPRKDLGDLAELTASIAAKGVLQNLTVVKNEDDTYTVIIGHRRLAAAKAAGLKAVPAVVAKMTAQEQIQTMLIENMQRADLTAYEQAQGFQIMFDFGDSVETIAEKTGFSQTTVRHRLKMAELDQEALREAVDNNITFETLYKLEKIEDQEERNKILEKFGKPDFGWMLRNALDEQENKREGIIATMLMEELGIPEYAGDRWWSDVQNRATFISKADGKLDVDAVREQFAGKINENTVYTLTTHGYFQLRIGDLAEAYEDDEDEATRAEQEAEREKRVNQLQQAAKTAHVLRRSYMETFGETASKKALEKIAMGFQMAMEVEKEKPWWGQWDAEAKKTLQDIAENKTGCAKLMALAYLSFHDTDWNTWHYYGAYRGTPNSYRMLVEWMEMLGYKPSTEEAALMDGTSELYAKPEDEEDEEE